MRKSAILLFIIPLFFAVSANAQSNVNERKLKSVAVNLGHHSIGFPFSFRTPQSYLHHFTGLFTKTGMDR